MKNKEWKIAQNIIEEIEKLDDNYINNNYSDAEYRSNFANDLSIIIKDKINKLLEGK